MGAGWLVIAALTVIAAGCSDDIAAIDLQQQETAAAVADFHRRIERYTQMRGQIVSDVGHAVVTHDPATIRAREEVLATRIRDVRTGAKHGDIFTPTIRSSFRRLLQEEMAGKQGRDIVAVLDDDVPAPGSVPIEVNAKYPAGLPFPKTPVPVLQALPQLPQPLEYRIIGKDLILLDQGADVILDYVRNAIP